MNMNPFKKLHILYSLLVFNNLILMNTSGSAKTSSSGYDYKLGTRMSFDISPGHIRNSCKKCERPNGKCGRALKCFCHPKECSE
nr:uncharacterized protein LOC112705215 [Arachis hypogaea]